MNLRICWHWIQAWRDIRSSIIHEAKIVILIPQAPIIVDPNVLTPQEQVARMIFKGKLEAYIKRKKARMLDDNIQKTYSLVIGQCTDLLQSKLKQQAQWTTISQEQKLLWR
jgi:hypothetical protein